MILLTALGLVASAQEPAAQEDPELDFADVVYVWSDKLARWRGTRWWVGMELLFPPGIPMDDSKANKFFRSIAMQTKAIIACDEKAELGRKRLEVACTIEDFAIQSTSVDRFKTEKDRQLVQDVLDDIDEALTGAAIELQVNERGAITNVGIMGLDTSDDRKRTRAETLRQILARMVYPFHMKLPKNGVREGQWVEYDSDLMSMPVSGANQGSSMIVHYMNLYKGYLLVQDIGAGVLADPQPLPRARGIGGGESSFEDTLGGDDGPEELSRYDAGEDKFRVPMASTYKLNMTGVSIYNVDNGVMEERVWNMSGRPNASTNSNLRLHYAGRIRLLADGETPDLGRTGQIGYPRIPLPELPEWETVDPEMQKTLDVPVAPPRKR